MKTPRKPCETLWRRLLAVAADAQAHGARDAGAQDPPRGLVLLREALRVQAVEAPPVRRAASPRGLEVKGHGKTSGEVLHMAVSWLFQVVFSSGFSLFCMVFIVVLCVFEVWSLFFMVFAAF